MSLPRATICLSALGLAVLLALGVACKPKNPPPDEGEVKDADVKLGEGNGDASQVESKGYDAGTKGTVAPTFDPAADSGDDDDDAGPTLNIPDFGEDGPPPLPEPEDILGDPTKEPGSDEGAAAGMPGKIAALVAANDPAAVEATMDQLMEQGPAAVPDLCACLESDNWEVRSFAVCTLGSLGEDAQAALEELKRVANEDENESVKVAAAFAIDAIAGK